MKNLIDKKDEAQEQTSTSWLLDDQLGSWSFNSAQARENYDTVVAAAKILINQRNEYYLIFTAMTHKRRSTACVTPECRSHDGRNDLPPSIPRIRGETLTD